MMVRCCSCDLDFTVFTYTWLGVGAGVVLVFGGCVACGLMIGTAGIGPGMR